MNKLFFSEFKKSALVCAILAASVSGMLAANNANAATVTGTVAISGTSINACTVTASPINLGNAVFLSGTGIVNYTTSYNGMSIKCDTGVAWSLSVPQAPTIIGGAPAVISALFSSPPPAMGSAYVMGTPDLSTTALAGVGTGAAQPLTLYYGAFQSAAATIPKGVISGSFSYTVLY